MTKEKIDLSKFDLRIVKKNIQRGFLDEKEYKAYLKELPDSKDNAVYSSEEPEEKELAKKKESRLTFSAAE